MTTFAQAIAAAFAPLASEYDAADVTEALSWAQSEIESYCNRIFDEVTDETVVITPQAGSAILPIVPVIDVSLVEGYIPGTAGMQWTELTNFWVDNTTGLILDTTGLPGTSFGTSCFHWPWLPASLRVTYSHGFTTPPKDLVNVACRLSKQWLENPGLRVQYQIGDIEERFNGSAGVILNQLDQNILDRYSIVSIA